MDCFIWPAIPAAVASAKFKFPAACATSSRVMAATLEIRFPLSTNVATFIKCFSSDPA